MMVSVIVWVVVGSLCGALASVLIGTDRRQSPLLNVGVGIAGAALAGAFVAPLLGTPDSNQGVFSVGSTAISLVGAILLLVIVNAIRRGRTP